MANNTHLHDSYNLKSGSQDNVTLTVTIGFAQLGATTINLDGVSVCNTATDQQGNSIQPGAKCVYPKSFSLIVGQNYSLAGKQLVIISNVERIFDDGQAGADQSSVDISLSGGQQDKVYPTLSGTISSKGDFL